MTGGLFKVYEEGELRAADIRSGLRMVSVCGSFAFVWLAIAIGMPLAMFMEAIGASGVQIGLVVAAQQLPLMLQIPSALMVERLPERKFIWFLLAFLHRVIWFAIAALPFLFGVCQLTVWTLIGLVAVSFVFGHMSAPLWQGWMADLVPQTVSARFWGVRLSSQTFCFLLAVWASGVVLDFFRACEVPLAGFGILFGVAAFFGCLDICLHLKVPEPKAQPPPCDRLLERLKEIASCRDFVFLTAGLCLWFFGVALLGAFTPICLKRDFSMNYTEISLFIMVASLGAGLLSIPLGRLGGRYGSRTLCALCMFVAPALMLAWYFVSPGAFILDLPLWGKCQIPSALMMMLPFQMVSGGLYAGVGLYQFHLAGLLTRREGRTLWMAAHWFPIGVSSALSPLLGGFLMDVFNSHPLNVILPRGCHLNFYHVLLVLSAIISWTGALLILRIRTKGSELTLEDIFRTVRTANPFRAVMSTYGMLTPGGDGKKGRD